MRISAVCWLLVALATLDIAGEVDASPLCELVVNATDDEPYPKSDTLCQKGAQQSHCTLRAAMSVANTKQGCTITFAFDGVGPHIIQPKTSLPLIKTRMVITGESEAIESDAEKQPTVVVNGALMEQLTLSTPTLHTEGAQGSTLVKTVGAFAIVGSGADGTRIQYLVLNEWKNTAILIWKSSHNVVQNNFIGTDAAGFSAVPNVWGVQIWIGDHNLIGGASPDMGNLIAGNAAGGITVDYGKQNRVLGNRIGTTANGLLSLPNGKYGIGLFRAAEVQVGVPSSGNVIANHDFAGITILEGKQHMLQNNHLGVTSAGTSGLGSGEYGIHIATSDADKIGGSGAQDGNYIAGNTYGMVVNGSTDIRITGNIVGRALQASPELVANSRDGIRVWQSTKVAIENNLIAGNSWNGITLSESNECYVKSNVIGLNAKYGIDSTSSGYNVFAGNRIGIDVSGAVTMGNGWDGLRVGAGSHHTIGGVLAEETNVIVANGLGGLAIHGLGSSSGVFTASDDNRILGNAIGITGPEGSIMANGGAGISIKGGSRNLVGGVVPGSGNIIVGHKSSGIDIAEPEMAGAMPTVDNALLGNQIYLNTGLVGIDLGPDGYTLNDTLDEDTGSNRLQNWPALQEAKLVDGQLSVTGSLASTPYTTFRVECFADTTSAGAASQARYFVGAVDVRTKADGYAAIAAQFAAPLAVQQLDAPLVVATATVCDDGNTDGICDGTYGDTSELSFALSVQYTKPALPHLNLEKDVQKKQKRAVPTSPPFIRRYVH